MRPDRKAFPLQITTADIDVRIVGHLAETRLTLTFFNPNARVMEGDLYFPLPKGAVVSGYALDINGVLVDGVVVERQKARQVFEAEVRKGIDPGLVEWTRGSNFKTRVYPIPARGTRTVRVSYVAEVDSGAAQTTGDAVYHLPLAFRDPVKKLSLRVEVVRAELKPVIQHGGPKGLTFGRWRDSYVAESHLENTTLVSDLRIALPDLKKTPIRLQRAADGAVYVSVRDTSFAKYAGEAATPAPRTTTARDRQRAPRRIGLYWDASLSRANVDHTRELQLLEAYLSRVSASHTVMVELIVFRNVAEAPLRFALPADQSKLLRRLKTVIYDGGSQLGSAQPPQGMAAVDLNLLFSDGISNFGREDPLGLKAPTYTIVAASTANHAMLRYIALRTGGAALSLQHGTDVPALAARIGQPVLSFLGARVVSGRVEELWPRLPQPVAGHFDLVGVLYSAEATIELQYGRGRQVLHRETVTLRGADASQGELLRRYWAQKKVDELLIFPERNADAITQVGTRFGIVTPGTSLLVLERLDQYVQHKVQPPASLPKMRDDWQRAMDKRAKREDAQQQSKLAHILKLWRGRVAWWKTRFKHPKPGDRKPRPSKSSAASEADADRAEPQRAPAATMGAETGAGAGGRGAMRKKSKSKGGGGPRAPEATIVMKPWNPETPYLRAIGAVGVAKQYRIYLSQRDEHGTAPAFFLDCASHFAKVKQPAIALRVLSNIAELKLDDAALMRVLAHRLAQIGELDLSIGIFSAVARLRPEDPQSHRDLALVIALRAQRSGPKAQRKRDFERALTLLAKVVMQQWQRFDEIELIALTEFNDLLPRARQLGVDDKQLDKRLIQQLDLDVRIVMTWDADLTDMDLHVVEPSGEEAYYGHNRTRIGGLVSRDFTRGYGPEVYLVRRAMKGKYTIRTKYFSSSAARLTGAVTLQVDVYTNYGRPTQKRQSVTLRLTNSKETFTVAEITF